MHFCQWAMELVRAGEPSLVAQCRKMKERKERGLVLGETTRCPVGVLQNNWEESGCGRTLKRIGTGKGGGLDKKYIAVDHVVLFLFSIFCFKQMWPEKEKLPKLIFPSESG